MIKGLVAGFVVLAFGGAAAQAQQPRRATDRQFDFQRRKPAYQVSMGYTHLLPSPYVMPGGQLVLGTTAAYGIMDVAELSTNLYLDFQEVFNVSVKANLLNEPLYALAVYASYYRRPIRTIVVDATAPLGTRTDTVSSNAVTPGAVFSYRLRNRWVGATGFSYSINSPSVSKAELQERTAFVSGLQFVQELTYGFNENLALSGGVSYDATYDITGIGASVHLGNFQIGAHYYLNVVKGSIQPIIGGNFSTSL